MRTKLYLLIFVCKGADVKQNFMRKFMLFFTMLAVTTSAIGQLKVDYFGNVGIGGAPTRAKKLVVYGKSYFDIIHAQQIYCGFLSTIGSDESLKENINPLGKTLNKLLEVESKRYNYKKDKVPNDNPDYEKMFEKETFGFIAQELEKVFPELVYPPSSLNEYYSINYNGMIPVLLEAIKEQQTQIAYLQIQFENCCQNSPAYSPPKYPSENSVQENYENEKPINNTSVNESETIETSKLFQNIPNPFSSNTEIRFEIIEQATSAKLLIHDMQGAEIKSYTISERGSGSIIINGFELQPGMYMYTLLVNNSIIDTKKMILTK